MEAEKPRFNWGHINVNVRNLERSIEFYNKLGFEVFIPGIPYLALHHGAQSESLPADAATALGVAQGTRGRACIMQLGNGFPKLDLTEFVELEQANPLDNTGVGLVRICLASEDLQRDVDYLMAAGVEFVSTPKTGHKGLAEIAVCKDPDGTLIELLQVYLDRWQKVLNPS